MKNTSKRKKSRGKKGLALSLATISAVGAIAPAVANVAYATPQRYDSVSEYIMKTWQNYPEINHPNFDAGWGFRGDTLYTTKNIHWTGYFNKDAIRTTDGTYEFKVRLNGSHADPYGWTFRHNQMGSNKYSFYAIEIGPYHREITLAKINSWIPSSSDPVHGGPLYHGTISSADGHYSNHGGGDRKSNALSYVDGDVLAHARIDYSSTQWATIKIENIGNRIKVWYNGQLKIDYTDNHNPLVSGGYGPYTASQYEAEFKDITVNGVNFLNIPPVVTVENASQIRNKQFAPGESIRVKGYAEDYDDTKGMTIYYSFDGGGIREGVRDANSRGIMNFDFNAEIPSYLSYGYHTLRVWAQDGERAESMPQEFSIFVKDVKPPTASIAGNPIKWTNQDITLSIEAFDYESGVKNIELPDGRIVNSSKATYRVSNNGTYSFVITDNAGNKTTKDVYVNRIDKTPPNTPYVNSNLVASSIDYESGLQELRYRINGGQWQTGIDLAKLPLGDYSIEVQAIDKAGNMSEIYQSEFTIEIPEDTSIRDAVERAERLRTQESVDTARALVNKMEDSSEKTNFISRLDTIQAEINANLNMEELIETIKHLIENATTLEDIDYIQGLIDTLPAGKPKNNVQVLLNTKKAEIINRINYEKALMAVMEAEEVRTQESVDYARGLVNKLPNGEAKTDLIERLDAIQAELYQDDESLKEANEAVSEAEERQTQDAIDDARYIVDNLPEGEDKDRLNKRLDEVQKIVDNQDIMDRLHELETLLTDTNITADDMEYIERELEDILNNRDYLPSNVDAYNFEYRVVNIEKLIPEVKEYIVEREIAIATEDVEDAEYYRDKDSIKTADRQLGYTEDILDRLIPRDHEKYDDYLSQIEELKDRLEEVKLETSNDDLLEAQRQFAKAQEDVETAESTLDRGDISEAKNSVSKAEILVNKLDASEEKDELLNGIEVLKNRIAELEEELAKSDEEKKNQALEKILDYEKSRDAEDRRKAQEAINNLDNAKDRIELQDLLDKIQTTHNTPSFYETLKTNYSKEIGLIIKYGETKLDEDRQIAQDAINKVADEDVRDYLQNMLDNILSETQLGETLTIVLDTEVRDREDIDDNDDTGNPGDNGSGEDNDNTGGDTGNGGDDSGDTGNGGNDGDNDENDNEDGNSGNNDREDEVVEEIETIVYPKKYKEAKESEKDKGEEGTVQFDLKVRLPFVTKPYVYVENGYTITNGEIEHLDKAVFNKKGIYQITFKTPTETLKEKISVLDIQQQNIQFTDIANHWAEDFINEIARLGIANGMPDKSFDPNSPINIADTFTFLDRTLLYNNKHLLSVNRESVRRYSVPENHWAYYTVLDIVSRMEEDTADYMFGGKTVPMTKEVTREELAQIIYEISQQKFQSNSTGNTLDSFVDGYLVNSNYREAMEYCVRTGILVGRYNSSLDTNLLAPNSKLTRAELMTVIQRLNNMF